MIEKKENLKIIALFFLLAVLFFSQMLLNPGSILFSEDSDMILQKVARHDLAFNSLKETGGFALWNHYIFSGVPLQADFQPGLFYPLNFFFLFLDAGHAFSLLFVLHVFFAAVFMFFFLKKIGVEHFPSVIGATTYGFSGLIAARIWAGHYPMLVIISLLPLMLYFAREIAESRKPSSALLLGAAIASAFLVQQIQVFLYSMMLVAAYFVFSVMTSKQGNRKTAFALFIAALIISAGIAAVQILPSYEMFTQSTRSGGLSFISASEGSLPMLNIPVSFLIPELTGTPRNSTFFGGILGSDNFWERNAYTGVLPLLLAIVAFFISRNKEVRFFTATAVLVFVFSLGDQTPLYWLLYNFVPFFSVFRLPSGALFLAVFSISVMAAIGAQGIFRPLTEKEKKVVAAVSKISFALFVFAAIVFLLAVLFNQEILRQAASVANSPEKVPEKIWAAQQAVLHFGVFGLLSFVVLRQAALRQEQKKLKALVFAVIAADLFIFGLPYITTEQPQKIFQESKVVEFIKSDSSLFRVLDISAERKAEPENALSDYLTISNGIEKVDGYAPTILQRYAAFTNAVMVPAGEAEKSEQLILLKIANTEFDSLKYGKLLYLLNAKYIAAKQHNKPSTETAGYELVFVDGENFLYENK
ncbi:MAG: hypothetical protein J4224_04480, partial [Candidatus Diapherotrites archaeon]|nr:hypothetical protein [Candidatus Diapherotrites archaeon]